MLSTVLKLRRGVLIGVGLILWVAMDLKAEEIDWAVEASKIVRLSPSQFSELPGNIVTYLQQRQCSVPQTYLDTANVTKRKSGNVISGAFRQKGSTDWAVICSSEGMSRMLVFWGGSTSNVYESKESKDEGWIQGAGNGRAVFSHSIDVATVDIIKDYLKRRPENERPIPLARVDHEGIKDSFVWKSSTVLFFINGKWVHIDGAD